MPLETDANTPIRRYAFYVTVVVIIAMVGVTLRPYLPPVVFGWIGALSDRSIFGLVTMVGAWMALLDMAVQFYRPTERVNAILLLPVVTGLSGAIGVATCTIFTTATLVVAAITLLPLVLHPAGRSVLRFERVALPNRLLVGLFAGGAIVLIVYGGQELEKQFTRTGEDALTGGGYYGDLAIWSFSIALWGRLGVFRKRDWRFATWAAGVVALFLGVGSTVFPDASSSLGQVCGVLAAIWAIALVGMTEYVQGLSETSPVPSRNRSLAEYGP